MTNLSMMNWKKFAIVALVLSTITGCELANKLVYRIDINQGNYVNQSIVHELRFGMTKEQVKYVLGPPLLVEPSTPNIWYYVHWLKPGHDEAEQKSLLLEFGSDEKLLNFKGDFKPNDRFYELYAD